MPVSAARSAAFNILLRVERESSYASELLHSAHNQLSPSDHALATELVMGVFRWRSLLDAQIAAASAQALSKLDFEVLVALRLALYQLDWLDRVPPRAAIHESVELVKNARKRSAAAFVNAVLRRVSAAPGRNSRNDVDTPRETSETLARSLAHPEWIVERWAREYGFSAAQKICQWDQSIPTTAIRLRTLEAQKKLAEEGLTLTPGTLLASARLVASGDITKSRVYRSGQVVIQDEASQLVAALLSNGAKNDAAILDCCAAPGGKTLAIADKNPHATIIATELHPHRVRLMHERFSKMQARPSVYLIAADARRLPLARLFDRILADVPCSGTGTLARNPEIKWRIATGDLKDLQARQCAILTSAIAQLAPGGRLVYATCSLEREENEDVVEQCLGKGKSVHVIDCREVLDQLKEAGELLWFGTSSLTRGSYLRTIPGIHPCDGFFAAILEKS